MGRKLGISKTIFVTTPINLDSIRKLRDAGYLTIIVNNDENAKLALAKANLKTAIERFKLARQYFDTCPMKDREFNLRLRIGELERARRELSLISQAA